MDSLKWIRDCCSLFVSNLPKNMISKELFEHFHEVGVVFDFFSPKNKSNGVSRGFGFVRYEWDAQKAINLLNGHMVGGEKILTQMGKYDNRRYGGNKDLIFRENRLLGKYLDILQSGIMNNSCFSWPQCWE